MIIYGGIDAIQCKMFMGTFTSTTLQWFSGLPDGHITSFDQFSELFTEQFSINQVKPPILYDLFNVRQREGESMKNYLNRSWALTVKLQNHDEVVMVNAFEQGIMIGPFSDLLIKNPAETFSEIRVVAHINAEEAVSTKHINLYSGQTKPKEGSRSRPLRVNETSAEKRTDSGARHTQLGEASPSLRPGRTWHFDSSSKYLTRNC
ncbi:uncharacterized protein [Phaseolus vulgaris]|uniref:uncharacterized protein n=1 Tax=Phaseolus vulgaris TaxID=3885 RepID=UPI0035CA8466